MISKFPLVLFWVRSVIVPVPVMMCLMSTAVTRVGFHGYRKWLLVSVFMGFSLELLSGSEGNPLLLTSHQSGVLWPCQQKHDSAMQLHSKADAFLSALFLEQTFHQ